MYDIIVIGGGPAGVTAALRSSELGAKVALVEASRLGGTCTNDGCAPTRVLAKAARLVRDAHQFKDYGLIGDPPVVDFPRLLERAQGVVDDLHEKKQLVHHLEEAGVNLKIKTGKVRFIDRNTIMTGDGTQLQANKIIICVGGHGRRFDFPGSQYAITHQDIWSLKTQPQSIAVVGGAATGSQLASIFSALGSKVTLFEISPNILNREDELISKVMKDSFTRHGMHVITGFGGIESIEKLDGKLLNFHYIFGQEIRSMQVEAVALAIGWVGNIEELDLAAAGIKSERGYIVVDDYFRTSSENIFAAGDITGRMMLVQSGGYEGRMAAENAILGIGQPYKHLIVPHGGFTDPEYASVGITSQKVKNSVDEYVEAVIPFANMDRAVIDGAPEGFCKLIVSTENHRIVGAHVVGEQAVEIIQIVAAAMEADMWVEQLAELELAYPTFTAIVGQAARLIVQKLGVMPLSPEWKSLGKPYAAEWETSNAN
jgi:pyruvate/2-oxoglutarate dehydrogenase complex dihydrolipoamide dehydrogenase (E3) component